MSKIIFRYAVLLMLLGSTQIFAQKGVVVEEIAAVIGNEIVLKSEIEIQLSEIKAQGLASNEQEARCAVMEEKLYSKLLLNQARIDSVIIEDDEVNAELDRRMQYFIAQIGSESALEEYFKKSITEIKEELRGNLREQITVQRMQGTITESVNVTPAEVKAYFNELPKDSLPLINTEVEVSQIAFLAPASVEEKRKAREKLNGLRERITNGEDFSTLAVLYSEDPGTSSKGGELGLVGRAEVDPAFGAAAFRLKGNEISRVVESQFGLHILQLIERRGEKVNVRHILIKPKINGEDIAKARSKADSVLNLINTVDTLSFEEAAYQFSEDKESKNNGGAVVNPVSGSSVFELDQLDPGLYYAIEKLEEGQISKPTGYKSLDGKQGYRIVKLKRKTPSHTANLKQDYQKIQQIAQGRKRTQRIQSWTAETIKRTHIQIKDSYKTCVFVNPWENSQVTN